MSEEIMIRKDNQDNIRLLIVGNSGSGKSTLADTLGRISNFPVLHLDELFWRPKWEETPKEEFISSIKHFILTNPNWIIDGNYRHLVGSITQDAATNIVWLDPPFWLYFPRLIWRTLLRLLGLNESCSQGCKESLKDVFTWGEKSIIWWCWTNHARLKKRCEDQMSESNDGKWIRLTGLGESVKAFQAHFEKLFGRQ